MENQTSVPGWFWAVSGIALVWNLMGVAAYWSHVTMSPADLAALGEAERALYEAAPAWATGAFAIAVFGGALGALLLLLRKAIAMPVLILSLLGVLVQMFHSFFISNSIEVYGPGGMIMPVMVIVISVFLVWMAKYSSDRGWIS